MKQKRFDPLVAFLKLTLAAVLIIAVVKIAIAILPNLTAGSLANLALPTQAASPLETAIPDDWKTYRDPDAGFTFRFPPDTTVEASSSVIHPFNFVRLIFKDPSQATMIIDVRANPSKGTSAELAAQIYQEAAPDQPAPKSLVASEAQVPVGSAMAEKYLLPPTLTQFMLFLPRNNFMVVIYPGSNIDVAGGATPALDRFNQVLASFTFQTR